MCRSLLRDRRPLWLTKDADGSSAAPFSRQRTLLYRDRLRRALTRGGGAAGRICRADRPGGPALTFWTVDGGGRGKRRQRSSSGPPDRQDSGRSAARDVPGHPPRGALDGEHAALLGGGRRAAQTPWRRCPDLGRRCGGPHSRPSRGWSRQADECLVCSKHVIAASPDARWFSVSLSSWRRDPLAPTSRSRGARSLPEARPVPPARSRSGS